MADGKNDAVEELTTAEPEVENDESEEASVAEDSTGKDDSATTSSQSDDNFKIVAAIDFGTTFSGYAYAFADDGERIYTNKNWGQTQGFRLHKTPTCLMLRSDGEFDTFGFEAVSKYNDLSEEEAEEYYYFDRFKMKLYDNKVRTSVASTNLLYFPKLDSCEAS